MSARQPTYFDSALAIELSILSREYLIERVYVFTAIPDERLVRVGSLNGLTVSRFRWPSTCYLIRTTRIASSVVFAPTPERGRTLPTRDVKARRGSRSVRR